MNLVMSVRYYYNETKTTKYKNTKDNGEFD